MRARSHVFPPALAIAVLVAVVALVVSFLTGDEDRATGSRSGLPHSGPPPAGERGGTVGVLAAGTVDFLDPGRTYSPLGSLVQQATQRTLYALRPGGDDRPEPDLAEGPPEIAEGNRRVTVRLRDGVRYSPPVRREVRASDVAYAIARAFSANVANPYVRAYFSDLVGAPRRPGAIRRIEGIETPDERTIVFRLRRPTAPLLVSALALPVTAPVPPERAAPFDRRRPSTYERHVAFTGAYMARATPTGRLLGWRRSRRLVLQRNPSWHPERDHRPAYLDRVVIAMGRDSDRSARRITEGPNRLSGDLDPSPGALAAADRAGRVTPVAAGGVRYVALNVRVPPFEELAVRRALAAALDRGALRRARGGSRAGRLATRFLPPGLPGFAPGAPAPAMPAPETVLRTAARRTGRLLVVGETGSPGRRVAAEVRRQLVAFGFRVELRLVPRDAMLNELCGERRARVAVCPNVGFFPDLRDPQALLAPAFGGGRPTNWSHLDDPGVDRAMREAGALRPGEARDRAWAAIDRRLVNLAPAIPWLWDTRALLASENVRAVANPASATWDLAYTSIES